MYTLTHDGESVGTTKLERGDPATYAVAGVFNNVGGSKALAGWIKSIGGQEDDGVVFAVLNQDFSVTDQNGNVIKFDEGHIIAVPAEDEAFLDIGGLSEADYNTYFADHISAMNTDD